MHSWTARANAIFAFSTFILMALALFNVLTTYLINEVPANTELKVSVRQL